MGSNQADGAWAMYDEWAVHVCRLMEYSWALCICTDRAWMGSKLMEQGWAVHV